MFSASPEFDFLEILSRPGPRLPTLGAWLMGLWEGEGYPHRDARKFLEDREQSVNRVEGLIANTAWRLYDEFEENVPPDRSLLNFLSERRPCAAVVFDGLSLRELPAILYLAGQSGLRVVEIGYSYSAMPSETTDFVSQRLGLPPISPSQLPSRRELRDRGIRAYYLPSTSTRESFARDAEALLIWSAFPDVTYKDAGARFAEHFAHTDATLQQAWMNSVQAIPAGRRILVTSDHGYAFFGPGLCLPRGNQELAPIVQRFGGQRSARLQAGEAPIVQRDVAVVQAPDGSRVMMLRGRVQTHAGGANMLYKHGGLSLMEMFTPWVVLEAKDQSG